MTIFRLCSNFAPAKHYQWGLFCIFLAKELVETWGLRRASYLFSKMPWKGFFGGKIRSFELSWMPKRPLKWPNMYWYWCILLLWSVWGSFWAFQCIIWGSWKFLPVAVLFLAILCLSLWMVKKLHFCGFAPTSPQLKMINGVCFLIILAKELEETLGLRRVSHFF